MGGCVSRDTMGGCMSRDTMAGCMSRDDACCSAREKGPLSPRPMLVRPVGVMGVRRTERLPRSLTTGGSPERYDLGTPEGCSTPELDEQWCDEVQDAPDGCKQDTQHFFLTHSARPDYVEDSRTAVARVPRLNLSRLPAPYSPVNYARHYATDGQELSLRTLSQSKRDSVSEGDPADSEQDSLKLKELELLIEELDSLLHEPDIQITPQTDEGDSANDVVQQSERLLKVQQSARLLRAQKLISTLPTRLARVPRPLSTHAPAQQLDAFSEDAPTDESVHKEEDSSVADTVEKSEDVDVRQPHADESSTESVTPALQDVESRTDSDACLEKVLETSAADWLESGLDNLLEQQQSAAASPCANQGRVRRKRRTSKIGSNK